MLEFINCIFRSTTCFFLSRCMLKHNYECRLIAIHSHIHSFNDGESSKNPLSNSTKHESQVSSKPLHFQAF